MARPRSEAVTLFYNKHRRVTPYGVRYRGIDKKTGKRRRFSPYFETEQKALDFKAEIEGELRRTPRATDDQVVGPVRGRTTLKQYGTYWLQQLDATATASTIRTYRSVMVNHVYPHVGDERLTPETFGTDTVSRLIACLVKRKVSYPHQVNVLKALGSCLDWARTEKHITDNPVTEVVAKRGAPSEYVEPEANPLTAEQVRAFLEWVRTGAVPKDYRPAGRRRGQPVRRSVADASRWWERYRPTGKRGRASNHGFWYDFYLTLLLTGMRRNEATGLQYDYVFLDDDGHPPSIEIAWAYSEDAQRAARNGDKRYRLDGLILPKGKKVRMFEPLPPTLVDVLRRRARTRQERAGFGRTPSPFVFTNTLGRQLTGRAMTIDRIFALGMEAIGATDEGHTVHDLRDTFATLHLLADPKQLLRISALLGHKNVRMTTDRYMRWIRQDLNDQTFATAIEGILTPAATTDDDQSDRPSAVTGRRGLR